MRTLLAILVLGLVACPSAAAQDPPANTSPPQVTGTTVDGATLEADPGVWSGTEPISFAFEWTRCGENGCEPVAGATAGGYGLSPSDVGTRLSVAVTASNDAGSTTADSPLTGIVAAAPPQASVPPAVTGAPRDGQVLTASMGTWSGTPPIDLAVRWERCTVGGTACSPIPGATSVSYVLSSRDVGTTLRAAVTASNAAGTRTARSGLTGVVAASPLVNLEPPSIVGVAKIRRSLMATTGRWAPSGPIDFAYRWLRCRPDRTACLAIPGATGARHQVRETDLGSRLRVRVTAISDAGSAAGESALTRVVTAVLGTDDVPRLLRPFPRVRIRGQFTNSGAVLERVIVRGPREANIAVRCRGSDCPFDRRTRRAGRRERIRDLERYLGAGTRIVIRVTKPRRVGKYTRILIRAGRPPARRDRCLMPGSSRPVRCPAT